MDKNSHSSSDHVCHLASDNRSSGCHQSRISESRKSESRKSESRKSESRKSAKNMLPTDYIYTPSNSQKSESYEPKRYSQSYYNELLNLPDYKILSHNMAKSTDHSPSRNAPTETCKKCLLQQVLENQSRWCRPMEEFDYEQLRLNNCNCMRNWQRLQNFQTDCFKNPPVCCRLPNIKCDAKMRPPIEQPFKNQCRPKACDFEQKYVCPCCQKRKEQIKQRLAKSCLCGCMKPPPCSCQACTKKTVKSDEYRGHCAKCGKRSRALDNLEEPMYWPAQSSSESLDEPCTHRALSRRSKRCSDSDDDGKCNKVLNKETQCSDIGPESPNCHWKEESVAPCKPSVNDKQMKTRQCTTKQQTTRDCSTCPFKEKKPSKAKTKQKQSCKDYPEENSTVSDNELLAKLCEQGTLLGGFDTTKSAYYKINDRLISIQFSKLNESNKDNGARRSTLDYEAKDEVREATPVEVISPENVNTEQNDQTALASNEGSFSSTNQQPTIVFKNILPGNTDIYRKINFEKFMEILMKTLADLDSDNENENELPAQPTSTRASTISPTLVPDAINTPVNTRSSTRSTTRSSARSSTPLATPLDTRSSARSSTPLATPLATRSSARSSTPLATPLDSRASARSSTPLATRLSTRSLTQMPSPLPSPTEMGSRANSPSDKPRLSHVPENVVNIEDPNQEALNQSNTYSELEVRRQSFRDPIETKVLSRSPPKAKVSFDKDSAKYTALEPAVIGQNCTRVLITENFLPNLEEEERAVRHAILTASKRNLSQTSKTRAASLKIVAPIYRTAKRPQSLQREQVPNNKAKSNKPKCNTRTNSYPTNPTINKIVKSAKKSTAMGKLENNKTPVAKEHVQSENGAPENASFMNPIVLPISAITYNTLDNKQTADDEPTRMHAQRLIIYGENIFSPKGSKANVSKSSKGGDTICNDATSESGNICDCECEAECQCKNNRHRQKIKCNKNASYRHYRKHSQRQRRNSLTSTSSQSCCNSPNHDACQPPLRCCPSRLKSRSYQTYVSGSESDDEYDSGSHSRSSSSESEKCKCERKKNKSQSRCNILSNSGGILPSHHRKHASRCGFYRTDEKCLDDALINQLVKSLQEAKATCQHSRQNKKERHSFHNESSHGFSKDQQKTAKKPKNKISTSLKQNNSAVKLFKADERQPESKYRKLYKPNVCFDLNHNICQWQPETSFNAINVNSDSHGYNASNGKYNSDMKNFTSYREPPSMADTPIKKCCYSTYNNNSDIPLPNTNQFKTPLPPTGNPCQGTPHFRKTCFQSPLCENDPNKSFTYRAQPLPINNSPSRLSGVNWYNPISFDARPMQTNYDAPSPQNEANNQKQFTPPPKQPSCLKSALREAEKYSYLAPQDSLRTLLNKLSNPSPTCNTKRETDFHLLPPDKYNLFSAPCKKESISESLNQKIYESLISEASYKPNQYQVTQTYYPKTGTRRNDNLLIPPLPNYRPFLVPSKIRKISSDRQTGKWNSTQALVTNPKKIIKSKALTYDKLPSREASTQIQSTQTSPSIENAAVSISIGTSNGDLHLGNKFQSQPNNQSKSLYTVQNNSNVNPKKCVVHHSSQTVNLEPVSSYNIELHSSRTNTTHQNHTKRFQVCKPKKREDINHIPVSERRPEIDESITSSDYTKEENNSEFMKTKNLREQNMAWIFQQQSLGDKNLTLADLSSSHNVHEHHSVIPSKYSYENEINYTAQMPIGNEISQQTAPILTRHNKEYTQMQSSGTENKPFIEKALITISFEPKNDEMRPDQQLQPQPSGPNKSLSIGQSCQRNVVHRSSQTANLEQNIWDLINSCHFTRNYVNNNETPTNSAKMLPQTHSRFQENKSKQQAAAYCNSISQRQPEIDESLTCSDLSQRSNNPPRTNYNKPSSEYSLKSDNKIDSNSHEEYSKLGLKFLNDKALGSTISNTNQNTINVPAEGSLRNKCYPGCNEKKSVSIAADAIEYIPTYYMGSEQNAPSFSKMEDRARHPKLISNLTAINKEPVLYPNNFNAGVYDIQVNHNYTKKPQDEATLGKKKSPESANIIPRQHHSEDHSSRNLNNNKVFLEGQIEKIKASVWMEGPENSLKKFGIIESKPSENCLPEDNCTNYMESHNSHNNHSLHKTQSDLKKKASLETKCKCKCKCCKRICRQNELSENENRTNLGDKERVVNSNSPLECSCTCGDDKKKASVETKTSYRRNELSENEIRTSPGDTERIINSNSPLDCRCICRDEKKKASMETKTYRQNELSENEILLDCCCSICSDDKKKASVETKGTYGKKANRQNELSENENRTSSSDKERVINSNSPLECRCICRDDKKKAPVETKTSYRRNELSENKIRTSPGGNSLLEATKGTYGKTAYLQNNLSQNKTRTIPNNKERILNSDSSVETRGRYDKTAYGQSKLSQSKTRTIPIKKEIITNSDSSLGCSCICGDDKKRPLMETKGTYGKSAYWQNELSENKTHNKQRIVNSYSPIECECICEYDINSSRSQANDIGARGAIVYLKDENQKNTPKSNYSSPSYSKRVSPSKNKNNNPSSHSSVECICLCPDSINSLNNSKNNGGILESKQKTLRKNDSNSHSSMECICACPDNINSINNGKINGDKVKSKHNKHRKNDSSSHSSMECICTCPDNINSINNGKNNGNIVKSKHNKLRKNDSSSHSSMECICTCPDARRSSNSVIQSNDQENNYSDICKLCEKCNKKRHSPKSDNRKKCCKNVLFDHSLMDCDVCLSSCLPTKKHDGLPKNYRPSLDSRNPPLKLSNKRQMQNVTGQNIYNASYKTCYCNKNPKNPDSNTQQDVSSNNSDSIQIQNVTGQNIYHASYRTCNCNKKPKNPGSNTQEDGSSNNSDLSIISIPLALISNDLYLTKSVSEQNMVSSSYQSNEAAKVTSAKRERKSLNDIGTRSLTPQQTPTLMHKCRNAEVKAYKRDEIMCRQLLNKYMSRYSETDIPDGGQMRRTTLTGDSLLRVMEYPTGVWSEERKMHQRHRQCCSIFSDKARSVFP